MDPTEELRARVALASRVLGKLDLTKATSGHVSARVPGTDTFLVRARGPGETGVRFTRPEDVILVDREGRKLSGSDHLDPPQEVHIHGWLYRTRADVHSVIHVHPATVVLFTICRKPLLPIYGAYDPTSIRLLMQGIPTYERSVTVSDHELGREFAGVMGDKPACLMRGHGLTTAGASVEEATVTAIKVNELAEMNYRAALLGAPHVIPDHEIAVITRGKRKRGNAVESSWRYYCALVGEGDPEAVRAGEP